MRYTSILFTTAKLILPNPPLQSRQKPVKYRFCTFLFSDKSLRNKYYALNQYSVPIFDIHLFLVSEYLLDSRTAQNVILNIVPLTVGRILFHRDLQFQPQFVKLVQIDRRGTFVHQRDRTGRFRKGYDVAE